MNCEIEFLPVGDGSRPGDAIVVRYGEVNAWELLVIDGGNLESGKELVSHVKNNFGYNAVVRHALVTHPDIDHASGMREVLDGLPVKNLWLHMPWQFAAAARPYFANKNWTDQGLAQELRKEYDILGDLVATAVKKNIAIQQPFAGMSIGPFQVVSPYQNLYPYFIPQFDRTPDAD
jgi:glyoxylase-like metal-dependent hydrolase (beta-lactamase superfamily II)